MTDPWSVPSQPPDRQPDAVETAWPQFPAYGESAAGPPGQVRPTGKSILLMVVTLGIYAYVYNYSVHREMKDHSGRGIGGGIALLLTFIANIAMPFVTSAEVGSQYARRGQPEPVRGWTGLWAVLLPIAGYILALVGALAGAPASEGRGGNTPLLVVLVAVGVALFITGPVIWFVKTNGALNRYWQSQV